MPFYSLGGVSAGILALGLGVNHLHAQTATQVVRFSVVPISRASVSAQVGPIAVNAAGSSLALMSALVGATSYAIATNESNQKISAALDAPMPSGVSLAIALAAPAGAASKGSIPLGIASSDLVTGISTVSAEELPIIFRLSAKAKEPITARTRTVTFTIMAGL